jgi:amino acid transporter
MAWQAFNYNAMETLYLVTSMFILLAGMAFQSGVTAEGSGPHAALTWTVALVLVTCVGLFMGMLALEVYRSYRFARRYAAAD